MSKFDLTPNQVTSILKLIDSEMAVNLANGDDAYNKHWEDIKEQLIYE